ncbi:hypothetical protein JG688_00014479, partial [Phytophthora aleatoria]
AQLVNWLSNGKTVDDAITLLRLNTGEGGELLKNPALSTWFSYVKMTKQNPDELSFLKLKTRFSDEELATMIAVTRDAKAWIYLEGLARVQLNNWLRMDKTADGIFSVLKLNKEGDTLFESPKMTKYYGDERLETRAKDSATTTSLALKLEQEMWMSQSKTADDVFNYLKLDKKGGDIFEDSALSTWVSYVNKLNKYKERPDEFAVISILEKRFDYLDLARMLV